MNYFSFSEGAMHSQIECEAYFPLRVVYDPSSEQSHFVGFYFKDTDLLEFTVNKTDGLLKKMQIVLCGHYSRLSGPYIVPNAANESCVYLNHPQHNDCRHFFMKIYTNCIQIELSDISASEYHKCGQVLFGVDQEQHLVSVIVTQMSPAEIAHTVQELQLG